MYCACSFVGMEECSKRHEVNNERKLCRKLSQGPEVSIASSQQRQLAVWMTPNKPFFCVV